MFKLFFIFFIFPLLTLGGHLPKTFKICARDSETSQCLASAIQDAVDKLRDGEHGLGLLPIDPLYVQQIFIPPGTGSVKFSQDYKNFNLTGISNSKILKTKIDFDKHHIYAKGRSNQLQITGNYELNGRVLVLPIVGNGKVNLTFVGVESTHELQAEVFQKKGKNYWRFTSYDVKFFPERVYFQYDNLFNGDETLGPNMNKFMNDNWKEIFNEMKGPFEESFGLIFLDITNRVFSRVPIDEIFPTK